MISSTQLGSITNLFYERERDLNRIIGNLQFDEVKTDVALNSTIKQIERRLLLEPVSIGEPKIVGNRTEQRQFGPNYINPFGGPQNVIIITVEFTCTGSKELFEYRGGGSLTIDTIYSPSGGQISVEVIVSKMDKAEALAQANDKIRTTKELIKMNNSEIENWSRTMAVKIKSAVESKKIELESLYE